MVGLDSVFEDVARSSPSGSSATTARTSSMSATSWPRSVASIKSEAWGWSRSARTTPIAYPDDGPELMAVEKREVGYTFPYLYDESQEVALAYQAACTPDFYVFDALEGARLPRSARRQPARQWPAGDRHRPSIGARRRDRGTPCGKRAAAEHGVQHQVEAGAFARILSGVRLTSDGLDPYSSPLARGISSAGRALAWHARGQGFKSPILHSDPLLDRTRHSVEPKKRSLLRQDRVQG